MQLACRHCARCSRGFTLVELLLTVGLLLLLIGAVVLSFSSLSAGAGLEEGASQLEALLRFSRAQAAGTGRQLQILFEEDLADGAPIGAGRVRVVWEPDPVARPGIFEDLTEAEPYLRSLNDTVNVELVRPWPREAAAPSAPAADSAAGNVVTANGTASLAALEPAEPGELFAPLRFYADGSADSVEIILVARDDDEPRRVVLRFAGMTGSISRRFVSADAGTAAASDAAGAPSSGAGGDAGAPASQNLPAARREAAEK